MILGQGRSGKGKVVDMSMYGKWDSLKVNGEWPDGKRVRPVVDCSNDLVLTTQSDRKEADINELIKRMEKAGMQTKLNSSEPFYGDVSEFNGLQDAIIKVQEANELFMGMSASVRERFDNDPVKMVEFLADPANRAEAEQLGMVVKQEEPEAAPSSPSSGVKSTVTS